jgi:hypothetical protein
MISRAVTFQVNVALRFPVAVELSAASVYIVPSIIDGGEGIHTDAIACMIWYWLGIGIELRLCSTHPGGVWKQGRVIRRRSTVST